MSWEESIDDKLKKALESLEAASITLHQAKCDSTGLDTRRIAIVRDRVNVTIDSLEHLIRERAKQ